MKKVIALLCSLYLVLLCVTAFAAPHITTLDDVAPVWSKTLRCDMSTCPRFELVMGGEAVLDHETGLVWEQSPSTTAWSWFGAMRHCNLLITGNRAGWRLPALQELSSLVDGSQAMPALPGGHPFSNVWQGGYWTATSVYTNSDYDWSYIVSFKLVSDVYYDDKTSLGARAWCVRGGGGLETQ